MPKLIREHNRNVDISADVFFVHGLPFIVTWSRRLKFIRAEAINSRGKKVLVNALTQVVKLYKCFGFHVHTCYADGEFSHLQNLVDGVHLDASGNDKHVRDIKRAIRVIKERVRAVQSSMPYTRIPRRVLIELVAFCVFWLNSSPPKGGVSRSYSQRTILLGTTVSQRLHCRLPFGSYAEVHDSPSPSNDTGTPRTTPSRCLGPTGNSRGTYRFFSLNTGAVIRRYQWTELPMTPSTVNRVHHMRRTINQMASCSMTEQTH